jgi:hypothetical protein
MQHGLRYKHHDGLLSFRLWHPSSYVVFLHVLGPIGYSGMVDYRTHRVWPFEDSHQGLTKRSLPFTVCCIRIWLFKGHANILRSGLRSITTGK